MAIYTMQGVCRYLDSCDIRALMCTSWDTHRVIRGFIDVTRTYSFEVMNVHTCTLFRKTIWPKIDVIVSCKSKMIFKYRYPTTLIIAPTSYDYTGPIILYAKSGFLSVFYCMWARGGLVDRNIYWWGYLYEDMVVHIATAVMHFTYYIDELLRSNISLKRSLRCNQHARGRVISMLKNRCGGPREEIVRSGEFAAILRDL